MQDYISRGEVLTNVDLFFFKCEENSREISLLCAQKSKKQVFIFLFTSEVFNHIQKNKYFTCDEGLLVVNSREIKRIEIL